MKTNNHNNQNNRFIFLSVSVAIIALFAFIALAVNNLNGDVLVGGSQFPATGSNLSGTLLDTAAKNVSVQVQNNASVSNVTFLFQLTANNSIMGNFTAQNTTVVNGPGNDTYFNVTVDTTTLPDGIYNISLMIFNFTGSNTEQSVFINESVAIRVIVDNTRPLVSVIALGTSDPYSMATFNLTFNASVRDNLSIQSAAAVPQPGLVNLRFDNVSGTDFNVSVENKSGHWSTVYNISSLASGYHTVTVKANDTGNNQNGTQTWNFLVNNAENVTWNTDYTTQAPAYAGSPQGQNISGISQAAFVLNVSTKNTTGIFPAPTVFNVIFMFDNGTGNDFNLTNNSGPTSGQYFNRSFNLSNLVVGTHTVTAHVNDTRGNFNNTEALTFTINNNPANVTWNPSLSTTAPTYHGSAEGQNFSAVNTTIAFNVSITNQTGFFVPMVLFWFDNATGRDFNLTNGSQARAGQYWNVTYNVSNLAEGTHKVYILVNDTKYNKNYTEFITFKVDKTAPTLTFTVSPSSPVVGAR